MPDTPAFPRHYLVMFKLEWRNGIRVGLKNRCSNGRVGSIPTSSIFNLTQGLERVPAFFIPQFLS